jgi:cyclopropane fatty-acyl-phospholipid synthase-like methyltransferase
MTDSTPAAWDARYAGDHYRFGEAPNAFLARQAGLLAAGQHCLAVADGEGRNGVWLAERGLEVVSMDASPVAQAKARRLAAARGVALEMRNVDLHAWTWPEAAFDVVVAIFIQFAEPPLRDAIFDGMRRTLRPGGLLIMEGYRPEQLAYGTGGPKAVENLYTEALLRDHFGDFEILELSAYDAAIDEGPGHSGPSALIDLVARKPAG